MCASFGDTIEALNSLQVIATLRAQVPRMGERKIVLTGILSKRFRVAHGNLHLDAWAETSRPFANTDGLLLGRACNAASIARRRRRAPHRSTSWFDLRIEKRDIVSSRSHRINDLNAFLDASQRSYRRSNPRTQCARASRPGDVCGSLGVPLGNPRGWRPNPKGARHQLHDERLAAKSCC